MVHAHISGPMTFGGGLFGSIKRVIALVAAFAVGALVLMAAGIVAIATAVVGLIIAFVAMLLRAGAYKGGRRGSAGRTSQTDATPGGAAVLNAKRTARGWTVDG